MEAWKTPEDVRAVHDAVAAYEWIMKRVNTQTYASVGNARQSEVRNDASGDPWVWWIVLSGLLAVLLSLPIALWALASSEMDAILLSLWMIVLPVLAMSSALGWFLFRVPRRRFDGSSWLAAVALSPLLMVAGIVGNLLTCGLGLPALALFVIVRANAADSGHRHT